MQLTNSCQQYDKFSKYFTSGHSNEAKSLAIAINSTQNAELFSISELQTLTFELIANLKNCKTRLDQFEVITNLACKFLS